MRQEECANCQVRYDDDDEKRIFDAKEGARCSPRALSVVYCIFVSICELIIKEVHNLLLFCWVNRKTSG